MDVWNNNQWKENSLVFPFKSGYCSVVRANWPGMYSSFWKKDPYIKEPCVMPKVAMVAVAVLQPVGLALTISLSETALVASLCSRTSTSWAP